MANYTQYRLRGSSDNPDRQAYAYHVTVLAGEEVVISFPYAADWGAPIWQVTPFTGSTITIHGTAAIEPVDEDWIPHKTHPVVTVATADVEELAARHLRFAVAGANAWIYLSTLQEVVIGTSATNMSAQTSGEIAVS